MEFTKKDSDAYEQFVTAVLNRMDYEIGDIEVAEDGKSATVKYSLSGPTPLHLTLQNINLWMLGSMLYLYRRRR